MVVASERPLFIDYPIINPGQIENGLKQIQIWPLAPAVRLLVTNPPISRRRHL